MSRRIRVSWDGPNGPPNREKEELYLVHVPSSSKPHLELDVKTLIKSWLTQCEMNHNDCGDTKRLDEDAFNRHLSQTSVGFLDVVDMKLAPLPPFDSHGERMKYVALSYVWGRKASTRHLTCFRNIMGRLEKDGTKKEDLPATILDAINLVRQLGYRYIWIDSLCIVQDNPKAVSCAVENMHLLFGNAHFTICAADGDDPSGGLRAWRKMDVPKAETITPTLQLLASRPSESIIQASTWNKRAWTFQERILSRRCVLFVADKKVGNRVYFQCQSTNLGHDIYPVDTGSGWHSDWRKSPLRTRSELEKCPIRFYMNCVRQYTGRNLTKPSDILNAFDGVSKLMQTSMNAPFYFGLPSSHFDFALLWSPKTGRKRRTRCAPTKDTEQSIEAEKHCCDKWEFPSWSWSGWEDIDDAKRGAAVHYPADFLEGALTDLNDWLLKRTWIIWYIRDKNGDLHPIWKGPSSAPGPATTVTERRWRGYEPCTTMQTNSIDSYGRQIRTPTIQPPFTLTQLENPFGVNFSHDPRLEESCAPILQFWTWKTNFYVVRSDSSKQKSLGKRLARMIVADARGDACGTVVVDESEAESLNNHEATFIALSEARSFTDEEYPVLSYYVPKDGREMEWDLFYVMLVKRNQVGRVWERVGMGKVLKAAFEKGGVLQCWEEIQLG
jgi:hypothetical protein